MPGLRCWRWDEANNRLQVFVEGTEAARFDNSAPYFTSLNGLTVTTGGLTITAGGLTVTAGGLTVTAGVMRASELFVEDMTQTALIDTATVTAAQLLTKVLDGTPTAGATYTLPTAELLVAALTGARVGDSFAFVVNNKSAGANTITVAGGAGGTGDGTLTVAQNVIRAFLVIITNVTAASEAYFVYGIG